MKKTKNKNNIYPPYKILWKIVRKSQVNVSDTLAVALSGYVSKQSNFLWIGGEKGKRKRRKKQPTEMEADDSCTHDNGGV